MGRLSVSGREVVSTGYGAAAAQGEDKRCETLLGEGDTLVASDRYGEGRVSSLSPLG
jgi:hypothetical protein